MKTNRRNFLKTTTLAGLAAPFIVAPHHVRGAAANEKIRLGVVGLGGRGAWITDLFNKDGNYEIASVVDYHPAVAEAVGQQFGVPAEKRFSGLSGYQKMLATDIDAVLVSVPHDLHEALVAKCAAAGKHVLCEKPMAMTLEGCRAMIKAAQDNNVRLMIAENHRFLPIHGAIREAIAKGLVGDVCLVRSYEGCNEIEANEDPDTWKGDLYRCGGAFLDMAVHKFGALEYMLGERVDSVTTMIAKQVATLPMKGDDNAVSIAVFESGALAEISVSSTQISPANNTMEVYGSEGTILENHNGEPPLRIYSQADAAGDMAYDWDEPEVEHGEFPGYYFISGRATDDHFAQCLLEGTEFGYSLEDSTSAVVCCLAGLLSFLERRPATRAEILALAETPEGTKSLYSRLDGNIPVMHK